MIRSIASPPLGSVRFAISFSTNRMIGHDSYEFIGRLYPHKFTDWVKLMLRSTWLPGRTTSLT